MMSYDDDIREWETWMDNLIIEDTFQKENIPFYQYSEFENVELISGNVYKAAFKISQKTVALKRFSLNNKFTLDNLINEIKRHRKLEAHNSILRFYGITKQENTNNYIIILKYANGGTLRQYLKTNFQKMDWNAKLNIAKQIANALMYLHSNEIIHGKLNSKNIFVHNGNIKLNDFEMAKYTPESLKSLTDSLGLIQYIDPQYLELFTKIGKNKSSDIFSLGTILWEISSGKPPFEMESSSNIDLLDNIVKGKREMIIPGTPSKYKETYTDCWKHNGNSRPNISHVVKNLSKIIISDANDKCETYPHNLTDEVISVKSEKSNKNDKLEVQSDPLLVDVSVEIFESIKNLFEFYIDSYKKQDFRMQPIFIRNYIRECNKNPVKILHEMISHPSHSLFTSLIGFFYKHGIGTVIDNQMAFESFSLASNEITDMKNVSPSLRKLYGINKEIGFICLAKMHLDGQVVEKDIHKAFQIYSKVADEGSIIALNEMANFYRSGFGVKKDLEKAFELYLKLAKGYPVAQFNVGECYTDGKGTTKDEAKGFQWCLRSANAGNVNAIRTVGYYYFVGKGVGKNEKKAFKWNLKAAEKGDLKSQYNLGNSYENGSGIDKDQAKAFEWYKKSAENDHTNSQYKLGKLFYEGCGTEKDNLKAIYWLNKAKENGHTSNLLEKIINKIN
ncbi:hypothetical protein Glove_294g145 [Diversispora epigaea]|uniref:Protein kinase domain-containing protein n=1 Tax=Diversispora epigaea TaxID=1348612 RepID=A0A397I744_9GLOM|nr:hypothetical protein Glove_294g145 [Diversispora epigaea]